MKLTQKLNNITIVVLWATLVGTLFTEKMPFEGYYKILPIAGLSIAISNLFSKSE